MTNVKMGHLEMALGVITRMSGEKIRNHKVLMDLKRTKKSLSSAIEEFMEQKNALIEEYGQAAEGGISIDPQADYFPEFTLKYDELVNSDADGAHLIQFPDVHLGLFEISLDDIEILDFVDMVKYPETETALEVVN